MVPFTVPFCNCSYFSKDVWQAFVRLELSRFYSVFTSNKMQYKLNEKWEKKEMNTGRRPIILNHGRHILFKQQISILNKRGMGRLNGIFKVQLQITILSHTLQWWKMKFNSRIKKRSLELFMSDEPRINGSFLIMPKVNKSSISFDSSQQQSTCCFFLYPPQDTQCHGD